MVRRATLGFFSGIFTLTFTYPLDVIRLRLSIDMTKKEQERVYLSLFDCMKKMTKNEGM